TKPPTDHPGTGTPFAWRGALLMPGGDQMTNMVNFFTSIAFQRLRPVPEMVVNNPGAQSARKYIACARTEKKDLTVVYVPEDRTVEIKLEALPPSPNVKWFNPRTGESTAAVAVVTDSTAQFPTPSEGDWILWMQTQVKK
ncbi:MAG TPA: putative collagen-binding domain-containing protein, partial [Candidatus Acidoferrum sp.]|nr:putative collagen-binding domain-containing protein [Candidatus Acidoferrum sp.]